MKKIPVLVTESNYHIKSNQRNKRIMTQKDKETGYKKLKAKLQAT